MAACVLTSPQRIPNQAQGQNPPWKITSANMALTSHFLYSQSLGQGPTKSCVVVLKVLHLRWRVVQNPLFRCALP